MKNRVDSQPGNVPYREHSRCSKCSFWRCYLHYRKGWGGSGNTWYLFNFTQAVASGSLQDNVERINKETVNQTREALNMLLTICSCTLHKHVSRRPSGPSHEPQCAYSPCLKFHSCKCPRGRPWSISHQLCSPYKVTRKIIRLATRSPSPPSSWFAVRITFGCEGSHKLFVRSCWTSINFHLVSISQMTSSSSPLPQPASGLTHISFLWPQTVQIQGSSTSLDFLGVTVDTDLFQASLPTKKAQSHQPFGIQSSLCTEWP